MPTRVSDKARATTPVDVHPAQAFFGMPRRIRLVFEPNTEGVPCDLTGGVEPVVVRAYRSRNYGTNYVGWGGYHPLTPYYRAQGGRHEWLPRIPSRGGWATATGSALVLGDDEDPDKARARRRARWSGGGRQRCLP